MGLVVCWDMKEGNSLFEDWHYVAQHQAVWQPVPQSLRVKPVEPKCDGCEHHQERDGATCCWLAMRFDPTFGMAGCKVHAETKED